jgi:hypothetical protein
MSMLKMTYEIAHDIKEGQLTREDALAEYGHLIDMETLDEILASFGSVNDNENGTVTIRVPDSWERTWSEDPA